jgi:fructose-specific phosphotransferase system IIC component
LVNLPGGSWAVGAVLGAITVLGATGGLRCAAGASGRTRLARGVHALGTALCCAAAFGPFFYLLSGLPGKNCRSESCAYIPGTGSAFLGYVISVGLVGWLLHRWISARAEEEAARERERVRRLRKKGKGKSRAGRLR